jgi:hypothetical protein
VLIGKAGPEENTKALTWLAQTVSDTGPDELVCIEGSAQLLDALREAYAGPIGVHAGTSTAEHGATTLPAVYDVAPGWVTTCRTDFYQESRVAANTALNAAKAFGRSVVLGYTGKVGIGSYTCGQGDARRTLTGMEIGDHDRGFGLLVVGNQTTNPVVWSCDLPGGDP